LLTRLLTLRIQRASCLSPRKATQPTFTNRVTLASPTFHSI
jgi:hypothetical protein